MSSSNDKAKVVDSAGNSPWAGRARTFNEYQALEFPLFDDPFKVEPEADIYVPGINGIDGEPTEYRIGKELWLPGRGFLYREALSCKRTKLNARMRAALQFVEEETAPRITDSVYVTEMVTPLFEFLRGKYPLVQGSEFLPGVPYGCFENGIRCEDLQALTFEDATFDLLMTFDVLEHVPEYKIAIHEMARVLKPGGYLVMTTPLFPGMEESHLRATINDQGALEHLYPAEYHGNPLGPGSLCFTTFGFGLVEELRRYGFRDSYAQFYLNMELGYWGGPEILLVAVK